MTPRKFFALLEVHNEMNTFDEDSSKAKEEEIPPMTLEELMRMR